MKYGIVSVIATIIDFVVLNSGIKLLELTPQVSKAAAFTVATLSVFRLQQRWVFRADPDSSPKKQLVQYWVASVAGFLASQGAITFSNLRWPGNLIYINVANMVGFGSVWVAKLVFFRFVVFRPARTHDHAQERTLPTEGADVRASTSSAGTTAPVEHEPAGSEAVV